MNTLRSVFVGVLLGIFTVALFSPGPLSRQRVTAASGSVISQVRASSVSVLNQDGGEGSGVLFHRFGRTYVITAAHVVEPLPYHAEVIVQQGDAEWTAIIVNSDLARDVALLRIDSRFLVGSPAEISDAVSLPIGTHLLHVGNLLGHFPESYLEGTLSGKHRRSPDGGDFDQTSIIAWPGSSGGGVFTTEGKLVGIITLAGAPGLNLMVPARILKEWAKDNDLQWLFPK